MTAFGSLHGEVSMLMVATKGGTKQVFPVDCEAEVSQRLVEASHSGDVGEAAECLADPYVDVNFAGVVRLRERRTDVVLREEMADEVLFENEEIRTEVSALFLAAHNGNRDLVRKLLSAGADVNQQLFRGFATTAAVREGRMEILELLVKSGASQPACEDALLEACCHNCPKLAELLMDSEQIRHQIATHALVLACARGFVEVAEVLMKKYGVDANAMTRILLRSLKPTLHANVDCTALVAAIVSRQVHVVRRLLQAGVKMDSKVSLGAWSWDVTTGEEFRVGAGLSDAYGPTWCAVEYFESTGTILRLLLQHYHHVNATHNGRTLLHHAIICNNPMAVSVLLDSGADVEFPVETNGNVEFRPLHMAARFGSSEILKILIDFGCEIDSRTDSGETAVMLCAKYQKEHCLRVLVMAGADLIVVNSSGASVVSIAASKQWSAEFQRIVMEVISSRKTAKSSKNSIFSLLMFASLCGDVRALQALVTSPSIGVDEQDENGYSSVMIAAKEGHVDAFRFLVFAGANMKLRNKFGETAMTISQSNKKKDLFENVILKYALEKGMESSFNALHCASRRGDINVVRLLATKGCDVNILNEDDYTPLMLAAREGHGEMCSLLISRGARCGIKTSRGETALSLARTTTISASKSEYNKNESSSEEVILDELSRVLVLRGCNVRKHTKGGRGSPHGKMLGMVGGVLRWGRSSRRNVVCKEVEVGASLPFRRCRRRKGDDYCDPGTFRVVTTKNKEVHFVCEGGIEGAELWVRGIRLLTRTEASRIIV